MENIRMLRRSLLLAATAAGALFVATTGSHAADKPITIGLALPSQTLDFFNGIRDAVLEEAKAKGVTVIVADAHGDSAQQVNQVQDMLSRKISALIYVPAGATAAAVPVRLAKAAGVPVVTLDRNPPKAPGDTFIASDSVAGARTLGDYLVKVTGGTAKIAILQGQLGTTPEVSRATGLKQAFADHPGMVVVAQQPANWLQDQGFTIAQDMLQKHPDITVFVGRSDAPAMGAAQAIKVAHVHHKIWVVGFDGLPVALKAVLDGSLDATMTQQSGHMGRLAVDSALDLIAGQKLPPQQLLAVTLTTKANAAQFLANHP
jgi:ribose transport system substrate-binding protein